MKLFVAVVMFLLVSLVGDWQEVKDWKPLLLKGSVKYASGSDVTQPQNQSQQQRQGTNYIAPLLNDHPQPPPPKSSTDQTNGEEKKKELDIQWRMMVFTGGLLVVGFLQVVLIVLQACYMQQGLEVTRQSAKAAQESADAALIQAKIMESRERPWIMVIPDNPESGYPVGGTQPFPFHFRWLAKNVGSSPAFLTELYVTAGIGDLPIPNQELPYRENPEAFAKFILPPDGVHESRAKMNLSPEEIEGYVNGEKCIMFYGLIKYDDARGDPHWTRFCCYWEKQSGANRFNPVGPPKTVEYT